jgi:hypothetical protein
MISWLVNVWESGDDLYRIGNFIEWLLIALIFLAAILEIIQYYREERPKKKYLPLLSIGLVIFSGVLAVGKLRITDREREVEEAEQSTKDKVASEQIEAQRTTEETLRGQIFKLENELAQEKVGRAEELAVRAKFEALKRTPPEFTFDLSLTRLPSLKLRFALEFSTKNYVPYDFEWHLMDSKGTFLDNVIWLRWAEVRPRPGKERWVVHKDIDIERLQKLRDHTIKLRIKYRSMYQRELGLSNLGGIIYKEYRLSDDLNALQPVDS